MNGARIRVDRIACDGRGLCAEVLPELIRLDDWGFPIITDGFIPRHLEDAAGDAVEICPKLALWLERVGYVADPATPPGSVR